LTWTARLRHITNTEKKVNEMARPRKVNPDGTTKMISVLVPQECYEQLKAEASDRNINFSDLLREILSSVRLAG